MTSVRLGEGGRPWCVRVDDTRPLTNPYAVLSGRQTERGSDSNYPKNASLTPFRPAGALRRRTRRVSLDQRTSRNPSRPESAQGAAFQRRSRSTASPRPSVGSSRGRFHSAPEAGRPASGRAFGRRPTVERPIRPTRRRRRRRTLDAALRDSLNEETRLADGLQIVSQITIRKPGTRVVRACSVDSVADCAVTRRREQQSLPSGRILAGYGRHGESRIRGFKRCQVASLEHRSHRRKRARHQIRHGLADLRDQRLTPAAGSTPTELGRRICRPTGAHVSGSPGSSSPHGANRPGRAPGRRPRAITRPRSALRLKHRGHGGHRERRSGRH